MSVTIEVVLPLDRASRGLAETLDLLRAGVARMGGGRVSVAPHRPSSIASGQHEPPHVAISANAVVTEAESATDPDLVRVFPDERTAWLGEQEIALSRLEFDLLLFLVEHPRRVFSRRQLLESVWGYTHTGRRTVDVHIRRLRVKFEAAGNLFTTIRGIGYRLDNEVQVAVVRGRQAA